MFCSKLTLFLLFASYGITSVVDASQTSTETEEGAASEPVSTTDTTGTTDEAFTGSNILAEIDMRGNIWIWQGDMHFPKNHEHVKHGAGSQRFPQGVHNGVHEETETVKAPLPKVYLNKYDAVFAPYAQEDFYQAGLFVGETQNYFTGLSAILDRSTGFDMLEKTPKSSTSNRFGRYGSFTRGSHVSRSDSARGSFLEDFAISAMFVAMICLLAHIRDRKRDASKKLVKRSGVGSSEMSKEKQEASSIKEEDIFIEKAKETDSKDDDSNETLGQIIAEQVRTVKEAAVAVMRVC